MPTPSEADFLNYFQGTLETHHYQGFQEYDWPTMWQLHEENIREKNEGGRDDVGWRAEPAVSEEDYWKSLQWYNAELMKDDYVMAACLYVVGAVTPWHSFEHLGGIIDRLERF